MVYEYIRTPDGHFKCPHCDYTRRLQSTVHMHIRAKHTGAFKHKCEHCNYETSTAQLLQNHMAAKHLEALEASQRPKELTCPCHGSTEGGCTYKCRRKAQLRSHYLLKHLASVVKKYLASSNESAVMCSHCGSGFASKPAFLYHLPKCLPEDTWASKQDREGLCI